MTTPAPPAVRVAPTRHAARRVGPDRAIVAGLTVLALALRVPNLGRAYWIDEAVTIGISSHRLGQIPGLLRHDGSPPLFYFVLHFWIELFGSAPVATHCLPLLISLATVPAGYWAGRELFGWPAGIATAALMATNPFVAWYSTETRMYTLVVLLALVGTTLAWRAGRDRRRLDAIGAVVTGAALLYTHAWCIYLVGATGAVLLWRARRTGDRALQARVLFAGAATLALWLPWVPSFAAQAGNSAAPWAVQPALGDFFADPATILGGTIGALVVPILAIGVVATRRERGVTVGYAPLIAATALATTVIGFVGALIEPSWTVRYLSVITAPYLIAAAGYLVSGRSGRLVLWVVCVLLAIWLAVGALLPNANARYAKDNMGAVAAASSPLLAPGDVVVVTETEQTPVAAHYLRPGLTYLSPTGPVADPSVVDWNHIINRLDAATPCASLAPTIDSLPVGARVLEIDPYRKLGAAGSAWSRAVAGQIHAVDGFLSTDRALTKVGVFTPGVSPRPYSPVSAVLWKKTTDTPSCA